MQAEYFTPTQIEGTDNWFITWNGGGTVGSRESIEQIVADMKERQARAPQYLKNWVAAASPELAKEMVD